ncbi:flagellar biosynthesis protein FlhB [Gorillibacterium massiliense]|uniref:flagellar biosynthesis protein FlhB n=1 Tax=Gorillibacterium massiliense TaxID=1280390 RepID=UPI0004B47813|nr:flagellar biosynthesis protein FlhB [Gorillibacterium massiliense]
MPVYRYRLDLQLFAGEKTEPATPKKRQDARKKGQVAKSSELPGAFVLCASFLALMIFAGYLKGKIVILFESIYNDYLLTDVTIPNVISLFGHLVQQGILMLLPLFAVALLIALAANYMQIGFLLTGEPLKMKFSKINPAQGFKRMFGMQSMVELLKSLFKMLLVGILVFQTFWSERGHLLELAHRPLGGTLHYVAGITLNLGIKIGVALAVLALFDYMYRKYKFEKDLRMSKQDIKDEYKKSEGDPLIKGKIRERQRRMAMQRMMQEVPKADVIITNPTHYAVALKYEAGEMDAPRVIAKGADFVAQKIKEIGKQNGVILMENRPLARALFDQVDIGQNIPADLFQAVAEVLAYVYKLKGKTAK